MWLLSRLRMSDAPSWFERASTILATFILGPLDLRISKILSALVVIFQFPVVGERLV